LSQSQYKKQEYPKHWYSLLS